MGRNLSGNLRRSASRIAIVAATATLLTACGGTSIFARNDTDGAITAMTRSAPEADDYVGGAAYWGAKFEANRGDVSAAINFARNLRLMGGARQAVAVMKEQVMKSPDNAKVLAEYGKALTAAGRFKDAIPFLARSAQMDDDDWTTFSTYGVALDQSGNHIAAQENYQVALKLAPGNPTIESNMAMSYVLTGRIDDAEITLRRLVARPDATPQMRQNLAMIETMRGNTAEAEQLALEDLPADQASSNLALFKQLDAQKAPAPVVPATTPVPTETPAPAETAAPAAAPAPAAIAAPEKPVSDAAPASLPAPAEVSLVEPAPTLTMDQSAAAPGLTVTETQTQVSAPAASRYTMSPIADDAEKPAASPKPLTAPAVKPAAPTQATAKDKVAATAKPTAMLRPSVDNAIAVAASN